MARLFITGASGFIGGALCRSPLLAAQDIVAVSRRGTALATANNLRVDDYGRDLPRYFQPGDRLIHAAAQAHQTAAPAALHAANADTVRQLAEGARTNGLDHFLLISSIGVNGPRSRRPFTSADAPQAAEPYALSKLAGEAALRATLANTPVAWTIVRPPLVYGPGSPGNFARLLRLIERAPLLPFAACTARRSLIHIDNLVAVLAALLKNPASRQRVVLPSDGEDIALNTLVATLAQHLGRSPRCLWPLPPLLLRGAARLAGQGAAIDKLLAPLQIDASELRHLLGADWRPPLSLGEALAQTAAAYRATRPEITT